ncbi:MAG TPA: hypothetical protein VN698_11505 [Bacteroidia bacterium]|nr:hypothetical protein [Bacteroidia bacterium]
MKKIGIALLIGAVMLTVGMLVGRIFEFFIPWLAIEYQNSGLFRPWSDPIMSLVFIEPFIVAGILVWLWGKTKGIISGNSLLIKGFYFGLTYWLTTIPGMIMSYSSFPVSFALVCSWSTSSLMQTFCAGFLLSKLLKE